MAFIGLGVTGGIGAYKAVEVRAAAAEARPPSSGGDDASARRFVGPLTFEAITREPVITSQFAPGAERRHRAHRARVDDRSAARRAGHREHHRQVRPRHRRRLPVGALPGHAGAGAARAGDEHQHVGAPGRARKRRRRSRRAACASSIRATAIWRAAGSGKGRLAEPEEIVAAAEAHAAARRTAARAARAGHRRADLRGSRSGALSSATDRAAAWDLRSRAEAARRGAEVTLVPARRPSTPPAVPVVRVRSAREMHAAVIARAPPTPTSSSWRPRSPTTRRPAARPTEDREGRTADVALERTPDILADSAAGGWRRRGRCWSALPRRPATSSRRAPRSATRSTSICRRQRRVAPDAGFDVDTNAVTIVGADGAEPLPLQSKARRRRDRPRSRRAAARPEPRAPAVSRVDERFRDRHRRASAVRSPSWASTAFSAIRPGASARRDRAGAECSSAADQPTSSPMAAALRNPVPRVRTRSAEALAAVRARDRRLHALQAAHARPPADRVRRRQSRTPI